MFNARMKPDEYASRRAYLTKSIDMWEGIARCPHKRPNVRQHAAQQAAEYRKVLALLAEVAPRGKR